MNLCIRIRKISHDSLEVVNNFYRQKKMEAFLQHFHPPQTQGLNPLPRPLFQPTRLPHPGPKKQSLFFYFDTLAIKK